MEYKIKDVCKTLNFGVSKFYRLKEFLDNSIPEQNRTEFYYNKGRNFYITDKVLSGLKIIWAIHLIAQTKKMALIVILYHIKTN